MSRIFTTIVPIFVVIFLGWVFRRKGYFSESFVAAANRLVYRLAIPAMIFRSVAKADFATRFNAAVLLISMACFVMMFFLAWTWSRLARYNRGLTGSFIQGSLHCNVGYIGLAVAFYYLGEEGLARAGIVAGFMMILQNSLAVAALEMGNQKARGISGLWPMAKDIITNPVISSAMLAMSVSMAGLKLPQVVDRCLQIVSAMSLPMALLIIGATLSFSSFKAMGGALAMVSLFKLVVMPGAAYLAFWLLSIPSCEFVPALILLASPTATVAFVMAKEMHGDPEFCVSTISLTTLLSALTLSFWLKMAG